MEMTPIQSRRAGRRSRPESAGVVFCAIAGDKTLDARLDQLLPLWHAVGEARAVLIDDGSLTGAGRTRLARECGDPEILLPGAVGRRGFPESPAWARLLAALDGRARAYWIVLDGGRVPDGVAPALARAVASNRSFAAIDAAPAPSALEAELEALAAEGWPYLHAAPGLVGFAAGGAGLPLAAALFARLEARLGHERARQPEMARIAANFVLAREKGAILLPFASHDAR